MAKKTITPASVETHEYSILKFAEGGISQKVAIEYLTKELGMAVKKSYSPYVGQYGLALTGTKEQHEKASDWLFGS